MRKIKLLYVLMFCSITLIAQRQSTIIQKWLKQTPFEEARFALYAIDLSSGKARYAYHIDDKMIPASVTKLITTATALELLTDTFRFKTVLSYDGTLTNGVLEGNVYIEGGGDPSLGSTHLVDPVFLPQWITAIRQQGIQSIKGRVIADARIFDTEGTSGKWLQEDLGSYYGAGSYGLNVYDNTYTLTLRTRAVGSKPQLIRTHPQQPSLHFHNYLVTAEVPSDSCYILGYPFSKERWLRGVLPPYAKGLKIKGDLSDPPVYLAQILTNALRTAGISVEQPGTSCRLLTEQGALLEKRRHPFFRFESPDLGELVRITNQVSHNLFADAFIKTLGIHFSSLKSKNCSCNDFAQGVSVVSDFWQQKGIDISPLVMYDGSGLSNTTQLSARMLCTILRTEQYNEVFRASFPVAGCSGTMRYFLDQTKLENKAFLKSGSMTGVKSYAGYIKEGNKTYAIALLVNGYRCEGSEVRRALEQLFLRLF